MVLSILSILNSIVSKFVLVGESCTNYISLLRLPHFDLDGYAKKVIACASETVVLLAVMLVNLLCCLLRLC